MAILPGKPLSFPVTPLTVDSDLLCYASILLKIYYYLLLIRSCLWDEIARRSLSERIEGQPLTLPIVLFIQAQEMGPVQGRRVR